jgi:hypothetical protein
MSTPRRPDLRDSVTVFVSTVGYPTFDACLRHLRDQDCDFRLRIMDHVAPLSAALQRMTDECITPYYVQVDEDMLLYPHAVRTLHERIAHTDRRVAQFVAALYDVHLERAIYGLKIFRREIVRRYRLRDVRRSEWDLVCRWRRDGYVDLRVPLDGATRHSETTLGLHGTYWTPRAAYLRFSVLELKRRAGTRPLEWVRDSAGMLLRRFLETGSEADFYALMGVLAGSLADAGTVGREKDYRTYDRTPGFGPLETFVEEVRRGWSQGRRLRPGEGEVDVMPDQREAVSPLPEPPDEARLDGERHRAADRVASHRPERRRREPRETTSPGSVRDARVVRPS